MTTSHASRRGFTLVELIVAGIMISLLGGATYVCISQTVRARDRGVSRGEAFTRANLAADLIAADVQNTLRDADLANTRLLILRDGRPGEGRDGILIFSNSDRPARAGGLQPEGQEYETQYRLLPGSAKGSFDLWRRRDPVPDENPEGGGVASLLVSGLTSLSIQCSDRTTWRDTWDSDAEGLPYGVRIVVGATDDGGTATSTARRVVAIDRVPTPLQDTEEDASTGTTTGSSSTGGTAR